MTIHPAADGGSGPRPAVLVLPGGAFRFHAAHEGDGYARWLSGLGLHAFVFRYPLLPGHPLPEPLLACREALDWIRSGPHGLDVDTTRLGVIGSSAGGLLAGLLSAGAVLSTDEPGAVRRRPDFTILAYAPADLRLLPDEAVSGLLDGRMDRRDEFSPVRHIDGDVGPTFLWATAEDPPGFPNALAYAAALQQAGVPVELHIYPHGGHGLGLADGVVYDGQGETRVPHTAEWADACAKWLRSEGLLPEPAAPRGEPGSTGGPPRGSSVISERPPGRAPAR
ncbi:alpha/beta hydrolase [Actinoplanes missouriensis]|nr:alpha/beta hydrolase [Actinoplanes missouriensis]